MGLDAHVYCNCFETGKLLKPLPTDFTLHVEPDGSLWSDHPDWEAVDDWLRKCCPHEDSNLIHVRLGNMWSIADIREELEHLEDRFPILVRQVVYCGIHGGDWIPVHQLEALAREVQDLGKLWVPGEKKELMDDFEDDMRKLVQAALSVQKPIVF